MSYFSGITFDRLIEEMEAYAAQYDTRAQAELIHETIARFREYTSGRAPSLDHAFGLVGARGKRLSPGNFELACRAYELKYRDGRARTWAEVEEALDSIHTSDLDGAGLKTLVHRNLTQVQAHFSRLDAKALLLEMEQDDQRK